MRSCCHSIEAHFERNKARDQLQELEQNGPPPETRALLGALARAGVQNMTVLDVGAGLGVIAEQLLLAGARQATLVDISQVYLDAAAQRLSASGLAERAEFRAGDLTELSDIVGPADVVTLDKVICCYPDMPALVRQSISKTRRFYGATYPRTHWLVHLSFWFENFLRRLRGQPFRAYLHSPQAIESLLQTAGFELRSLSQTFSWRIVLFERRPDMQQP